MARAFSLPGPSALAASQLGPRQMKGPDCPRRESRVASRRRLQRPRHRRRPTRPEKQHQNFYVRPFTFLAFGDLILVLRIFNELMTIIEVLDIFQHCLEFF